MGVLRERWDFYNASSPPPHTHHHKPNTNQHSNQSQNTTSTTKNRKQPSRVSNPALGLLMKTDVKGRNPFTFDCSFDSDPDRFKGRDGHRKMRN
jgi:hypothetical protein